MNVSVYICFILQSSLDFFYSYITGSEAKVAMWHIPRLPSRSMVGGENSSQTRVYHSEFYCTESNCTVLPGGNRAKQAVLLGN